MWWSQTREGWFLKASKLCSVSGEKERRLSWTDQRSFFQNEKIFRNDIILLSKNFLRTIPIVRFFTSILRERTQRERSSLRKGGRRSISSAATTISSCSRTTPITTSSLGRRKADLQVSCPWTHKAVSSGFLSSYLDLSNFLQIWLLFQNLEFWHPSWFCHRFCTKRYHLGWSTVLL